MSEYTESAAADQIRDYLLSRKDQIKIIEYLASRDGGKFTFALSGVPETILDLLLENPDEFPKFVRQGINQIVQEWYHKEITIDVTLAETSKIKMRNWNSDYEGTVVSATVQVIGMYREETYNISGECHCPGCDNTTGFRGKPPVCMNDDCKRKYRDMEINPKKLKTGMQRIILVQEPVEEVQFPAVPRTMEVIIRDDAVHSTHTGQRKKITGVFRSQPQKGKDTNRFYIHAISVQDADDQTLILPNQKQLEKFTDLATDEEKYLKVLSRSFAPHIYGEYLAKLCLMLSRVSGSGILDNEKDILDTLLVGDPGTSKSELLKFAVAVTQKSAYASGGTASLTSITASMMTMPNREKFVAAGIISQCTGSLVALDEIAQFGKEEMGKLLECLSLRTIHYNKGGIKADLIAETAIVAAANPVHGMYSPALGMTKNIGLPAPLIDRFGLILNMQQKRTRREEEEKTSHIEKIDRLGIDGYITEEGLFTKEELIMLFNHCKNITPKITDGANKIIKDFYFTMFEIQADGEQEDHARQINTRFQIALRRIAKAYARLVLSDKVTEGHAVTAKEIMVKCLQSFGLKTDRGEMQLNLRDDPNSKPVAFDHVWEILVKETGSDLIDPVSLYKRLQLQYPKLFRTTADIDKIFNEKHGSGDLIMENGRYRMV